MLYYETITFHRCLPREHKFEQPTVKSHEVVAPRTDGARLGEEQRQVVLEREGQGVLLKFQVVDSVSRSGPSNICFDLGQKNADRSETR